VLRHAFGIFAVAVAGFMGFRAFVPASDEKRLHLAPAYTAVPGAIGGAIAGLFSSGAAVFSVAALDYGFALPQVAAQGLATLVEFPATVTSLGIFAAAHDVHWLRGVELAVGGALTVHLGARLAQRLPERLMRILFFFYVIAAAAGLFLKYG
jgi:uncharacterized membrane protein YfcA